MDANPARSWSSSTPLQPIKKVASACPSRKYILRGTLHSSTCIVHLADLAIRQTAIQGFSCCLVFRDSEYESENGPPKN